jgi:mono/diheme cytochrome c family protein/plastocyanin
MRRERLARFLLLSLLTLAVLAVGAGWYGQNRVVTVRARMPEQGGWMPVELKAVAGEPLQLRLTSEDVTHSFAVGKMDLEPIDIHPGEVAEISLTFDEPGTYTYYCTRWCGANHWRMRGTIEVSGEPSQASIAEKNPPLYVELGIDIDAPHPAQVIPSEVPVTAASGNLLNQVPESYRESTYYRTHSPAEAWQALRADPFTQGLDNDAVWSLVATIWQANTTPGQLAQGKELYAQNCAACHGENGAGDGVFASQPGVDNSMKDIINLEDGNGDGHGLKAPADFTDAENMLGASPALLHGKIVRGGMGTGMPYWGPILTDEQIWALVAYLWTYQLEYNLEVNQ